MANTYVKGHITTTIPINSTTNQDIIKIARINTANVIHRIVT